MVLVAQGILKGGAWTRTKAHRVYFPAEESEVIGEGGEDAGPPSDDDEDGDDRTDWSAAVVEDDPHELEEERVSTLTPARASGLGPRCANFTLRASRLGSVLSDPGFEARP